jgi:hypothetical protein
VNTGMTLIAKLNLNLNNAHKSKLLLEGLMRKFPDNETIKLQWIDALATTDPTKSLAELDGLKKNAPVFYGQKEKFVRLIKAKALENLKEIDRAKSEYKYLLDSDFKSVAESKIFEYEEREKLEQELRDKIAKQNQSVEINQTRNSRRLFFIISINIIGLIIIIFLIRKRRHK